MDGIEQLHSQLARSLDRYIYIYMYGVRIWDIWAHCEGQEVEVRFQLLNDPLPTHEDVMFSKRCIQHMPLAHSCCLKPFPLQRPFLGKRMTFFISISKVGA